MTSEHEWITLAEASARHGKAIETIRRWVTMPGADVRTEIRHGTRYANAADVARIAARHPAPVESEARTACAKDGHQPDPDAVAALGLDADQWLTLAAAGRATSRTKSSLTLWIHAGELRAVHCRCQWRRFIWKPDLDIADNHHHKRGDWKPHVARPDQRKGTTR